MLARAAALLIVGAALAAPAGALGQSYRIPPDNPFVSTAGARGEIYVYGLRNPFRWSFDRQTGDMIIGDVGGIREEITFLARASAAGSNLGWDCFSGTAVSNPACSPPNHTGPSYEYPSSADVVIGGYVVRDPTLPSFAGRYLFGRFNGNLLTLGPQATGPPVDAGADVPLVTGFGEDGAGRLHAVSLQGSLYRLTEAGTGVLAANPLGSFDQPVAVAAPPGDPDRLFVVERPGRVQLRTGASVSEFLDLSALVRDTGGEEGLLAFAVAPDYAASGRVFVYYTDNNGDLQLDEFSRTAAGPDRSSASTRKPILTIPHPGAENHNGGQLLFGPDDFLYLSTGDGGGQGDPGDDAQSLGSLLGKIVRLDVGAAPAPVTARLVDSDAPRLSTRVTGRQRVLRLGAAIARARCSEDCSIAAGGRLRVGRSSFAMRRVVRPAPANARRRLEVRLSRRGQRALRRALRRDRRATVRLRLRARDLSGNRSRLARRAVRVRR